MNRTGSGFRWLVFFACGVAFLPLFAAAQEIEEESTPINADFISQYGLRNLENAVLIRATPEHPGAGESVHFTAESPLFSLSRDTITWTVNGRTIATGVGVVSADAVVDSRGSSLDVMLTVVDAVWGPASYRFQLIPLQLDILFDAPTYVPPFYRGRAMPSAGGKMRLEARARFVTDGRLVADSSIHYAWSRGSIALGSVSGLGKSSIVIDAPALYDKDTITVRATANDGSLSASASVIIPSQPVEVGLYEDHPLFGVMFHQLFARENQVPGEITVAAFPYFVTAPGLYDPALRFAWTLNGSRVAASSTKRNEITISSSEEPSSVQAAVTHAANFFLDAVGSWKFIFGTAGSGAGGAAGAQNSDVFHSESI